MGGPVEQQLAACTPPVQAQAKTVSYETVISHVALQALTLNGRTPAAR